MVNLMSNDAAKFEQVAHFTDDLLFPLYLGGCVALLFSMLGPAVLPGIVVMAASVLTNMRVGKALMKLRRSQLSYTDRRVRLISEVMSGIRVVKYNVMEDWLQVEIGRARAEELALLRRQAILNAINRFISECSNGRLGLPSRGSDGRSLLQTDFASPLLVAIVTFSTYVLLGNVLEAGDVFSSLALFALLRNYLSWFPRGIAILSQALVSQRRIAEFLAEAEHVAPASSGNDSSGGTVSVRDASLSHSTTGPPVLAGVNLHVGAGELLVIVGAVGAGKTSLLHGLLGELVATGTVSLQGRLALCEQQPWVQAGSLRSNILFGRSFDAKRYASTLEACALLDDLENLPGGDAALIGEKGVTLSGGQKARVALARAVFSDADVVLMDDVLAAVDVHVGEHLRAACICGQLAKKTRLLVTNSAEVLPFADTIVALEDGAVVASGTHEQLTQQLGEREAWAQMFAPPHNLSPGSASVTSPRRSLRAQTSRVPGHAAGAAEEEDEARKKGKVAVDVYAAYFRAGGGIGLAMVLFLLGWCLPQIAATMGEWVLAQWTVQMSAESAANTAAATTYYGGIYVGLNVLSMVMVLGRSVAWAQFTVRASDTLHADLLDRVLRFPMSFFEKTPLGVSTSALAAC